MSTDILLDSLPSQMEKRSSKLVEASFNMTKIQWSYSLGRFTDKTHTYPSLHHNLSWCWRLQEYVDM